MEPRILLFDVEIAASIGYYWPGERYKEGAIIANIEPAYTLSFSCKWLGQKKTYTKALPDYPGYKRNPKSDKELIADLSGKMGQSHVVCAHNGNAFDIPWVQTRCLINKLPPLPNPLSSIDTCQAAKKLRFESRKLDQLGATLELGRKRLHHGFPLWHACMNGDLSAFREMKLYNAQDVTLLEAVYYEMRPFIQKHPDLNNITRAKDCPACQSTSITADGWAYVASGRKQRWLCGDCNYRFISRKIERA